MKPIAGETGLALGQDTVGGFGTWCISSACVQTTRQGVPVEVHPPVFAEHRVQKLMKQSISKQLPQLFLVVAFLVLVLPGKGRFVFFPSFFFPFLLNQKAI